MDWDTIRDLLNAEIAANRELIEEMKQLRKDLGDE